VTHLNPAAGEIPAGAVAPFNTSKGFWLEHAAAEQPAYTT